MEFIARRWGDMDERRTGTGRAPGVQSAGPHVWLACAVPGAVPHCFCEHHVALSV